MAMVRGKDMMASVMGMRIGMMHLRWWLIAMIMKKIARMIMLRLSNR